MDIIINQRDLHNALRTVERLVAKNVSLPILNTILLQTENGRLRLAATNLEMGINYWISAKINHPGEVAVPARVFSDFIANIGDEKVALQMAKNIITIDAPHYHTQLLGMDTKEFPIIPASKTAIPIKLHSATLRNALVSVLDAAALSETRPELAGIYIGVSRNKIDFAATDSFRLAEQTVTTDSGAEKIFILPRTAALELARLSEEDSQLTLAVADQQIFARGANFQFISRLIDGHYPEYKRIIPERFIAFARVNRQALERNIRLASIFSSSISDIKLSIGKNQLTIEAKNSERGEIAATVPCVLKNEPFAVALNFKYLLDGLKTIPTENVLIQYTGDGSPLVLRPEERKDQTYLIMPLRH